MTHPSVLPLFFSLQVAVESVAAIGYTTKSDQAAGFATSVALTPLLALTVGLALFEARFIRLLLAYGALQVATCYSSFLQF